MDIRYDNEKIRDIAARLGVSEGTVLAYLRSHSNLPWSGGGAAPRADGSMAVAVESRTTVAAEDGTFMKRRALALRSSEASAPPRDATTDRG